MRHLVTSVILICTLNLGNAQDKTTYTSSTFCFPVSNLEASIKWYNQLLVDVESFSPAEGVMEFQLNGNTWLQLFEGPLANGAILRLEVDNIHVQHERLVKFGLYPTPVELVPGVVSYFDFKDPDGNQLSFYELESP